MEITIEESALKNRWGDPIKHLIIDGYIWMSNDNEEMEEMYADIKDARGHCWIGGLGLGLMPEILAQRSEVDSISVVEINEDIIDLVAPRLEKTYPGKISVFCGDALQKEGFLNKQYDWLYLDTYIEPTRRVYEEEVQYWLNNMENFIHDESIVKWWAKDRMERGDFAPFEFEK